MIKKAIFACYQYSYNYNPSTHTAIAATIITTSTTTTVTKAQATTINSVITTTAPVIKNKDIKAKSLEYIETVWK